MSMALSDLQDEVRELTGDDSTDLPDAALNKLINRAYEKIRDVFPFRVEETTSVAVPTVDGTKSYGMPTGYDHLVSIAIVDDNSKHFKLERITRQYYETVFVDTTDNEAFPTNYFRENDQIILYPTPDNAYTLVITYNATLTDLSAAGDVPEIPAVWHEILAYGAGWRRFIQLSDYARANALKAHQNTLIADIKPVEAKEDVDFRMAHVEVPDELFII